MSFNFETSPKVNGKIALVTGGNSGLGYETVKALALKGAKVYLTSRDITKGEKAKSEILTANPALDIQVLKLDLASIKSIENAVAEIKSKHNQLDFLINNAGIMAMPYRETEDGFESQFGVNHLGHWVLTSSLMPLLLASEKSKVVTVSSTARHMAREITEGDFNFKANYSPWGSYGHSKLANYYFGIGLARIIKRVKVSQASFIAHPGISNTNLQVQTAAQGGAGATGKYSESLAAKLGMSAWRGAQSQIRAALDPKATNGDFYGPRFAAFGDPVKLPILKPGASKNIELLWRISKEATGYAIDF